MMNDAMYAEPLYWRLPLPAIDLDMVLPLVKTDPKSTTVKTELKSPTVKTDPMPPAVVPAEFTDFGFWRDSLPIIDFDAVLPAADVRDERVEDGMLMCEKGCLEGRVMVEKEGEEDKGLEVIGVAVEGEGTSMDLVGEVSAETTPAAVPSEFSDILFWRHPLPILDFNVELASVVDRDGREKVEVAEEMDSEEEGLDVAEVGAEELEGEGLDVVNEVVAEVAVQVFDVLPILVDASTNTDPFPINTTISTNTDAIPFTVAPRSPPNCLLCETMAMKTKIFADMTAQQKLVNCRRRLVAMSREMERMVQEMREMREKVFDRREELTVVKGVVGGERETGEEVVMVEEQVVDDGEPDSSGHNLEMSAASPINSVKKVVSNADDMEVAMEDTASVDVMDDDGDVPDRIEVIHLDDDDDVPDLIEIMDSPEDEETVLGSDGIAPSVFNVVATDVVGLGLVEVGNEKDVVVDEVIKDDRVVEDEREKADDVSTCTDLVILRKSTALIFITPILAKVFFHPSIAFLKSPAFTDTTRVSAIVADPSSIGLTTCTDIILYGSRRAPSASITDNTDQPTPIIYRPIRKTTFRTAYIGPPMSLPEISKQQMRRIIETPKDRTDRENAVKRMHKLFGWTEEEYLYGRVVGRKWIEVEDEEDEGDVAREGTERVRRDSGIEGLDEEMVGDVKIRAMTGFVPGNVGLATPPAAMESSPATNLSLAVASGFTVATKKKAGRLTSVAVKTPLAPTFNLDVDVDLLAKSFALAAPTQTRSTTSFSFGWSADSAGTFTAPKVKASEVKTALAADFSFGGTVDTAMTGGFTFGASDAKPFMFGRDVKGASFSDRFEFKFGKTGWEEVAETGEMKRVWL